MLQHLVLLSILGLLGLQLLVELLLAQAIDELLAPPHQSVHFPVLLHPPQLDLPDLLIDLPDGHHDPVQRLPVLLQLLLFLLLLQLEVVYVHCVVLQLLVQVAYFGLQSLLLLDEQSDLIAQRRLILVEPTNEDSKEGDVLL